MKAPGSFILQQVERTEKLDREIGKYLRGEQDTITVNGDTFRFRNKKKEEPPPAQVRAFEAVQRIEKALKKSKSLE